MSSDLLTKLFEHYPLNDNNELITYCSNKKVESAKDFFQVYADYLAQNETNMSVYMSSSWAICQEKLDNLSYDDLEYTKSRSGIWSLSYESGKMTTFREVARWLETSY